MIKNKPENKINRQRCNNGCNFAYDLMGQPTCKLGPNFFDEKDRPCFDFEKANVLNSDREETEDGDS